MDTKARLESELMNAGNKLSALMSDHTWDYYSDYYTPAIAKQYNERHTILNNRYMSKLKALDDYNLRDN